MTYRRLKSYLEHLSDDELSRDIVIKINDEYYVVSALVNTLNSDVFDDAQLILEVIND